ncbi:SRPBCC family protein [Streptomyces sp. NPDC015131]|uniref:SRPBCC family protein n=1 Tax=Streptomyces sp. NPDC015131 TaxID=3364941 RepID=UPI0036F95C5B
MARRLRPVGLDFLISAPLRLVHTSELAATPAAVYRALADDVPGTPSWWPAVTAARPTAGGAGREVRLRGGLVFQERILVSDAGERYAYRVEEANAPGLRALMEEWLLTPAPAGPGTRVRWTMAVDAAAPLRTLLRAARPGVVRSVRDALRELDRRLAASPAP